jgi:WD40 repeat protein
LNKNRIVCTLIFLLFVLQIHAQTKADLIVQLSHVERIGCMAINQSGTLLATGSEDHTVKLWNVQSGLLIRSFYGLREGVRGICFADNDAEIMAGDGRGNLISWQLNGKTIFYKKLDDGIVSIQKSHTQNNALIAAGNTIYEMYIDGKEMIKK